VHARNALLLLFVIICRCRLPAAYVSRYTVCMQWEIVAIRAAASNPFSKPRALTNSCEKTRLNRSFGRPSRRPRLAPAIQIGVPSRPRQPRTHTTYKREPPGRVSTSLRERRSPEFSGTPVARRPTPLLSLSCFRSRVNRPPPPVGHMALSTRCYTSIIIVRNCYCNRFQRRPTCSFVRSCVSYGMTFVSSANSIRTASRLPFGNGIRDEDRVRHASDP